ncbi:hydroxymethylglutaryl-CoA lyase [Pseudomonas sp. S 311-6]|nr:hydroxymethylglutaryl-CoA lyase [Pseudomonas sp. S 311-6]
MHKHKEKIVINEVGFRDGLQSIDRVMSTDDKKRWMDACYEAGVRHMEVASFVPARLLPQMADAAELVAHALQLPGLRITALVPNLRGAENALACGVHRIVAPVSVSAAHSLANVRKTPEQMVEEMFRIRERRNEMGLSGVTLMAGMSVAFGCTRQGRVPLETLLSMVKLVLDAGVDEVSLGDTTGHATPGQVGATLDAVQAVAGGRLRGAHFHDTRGLALSNSLVAVQHGIRELDASLGGLGGCPFAPGASGNTVTEDLVFMLESMGFDTGIDIEKLLAARQIMAAGLPGETLYGHIARAGVPLGYQGAWAA